MLSAVTPTHAFHLFVASGIIHERFGTLLAAVHTLAVAVLGICAVNGTMALSVRKVARFAIVTVLLTAGVLGGARVLLRTLLSHPYTKDMALTGIELLHNRGSASV